MRHTMEKSKKVAIQVKETVEEGRIEAAREIRRRETGFETPPSIIAKPWRSLVDLPNPIIDVIINL